MRRFGWLLAVWLLVTAGSAMARQRVADAVCDAPAGWRMLRQGAGMIFVAPNGKAGIFVLPGSNYSGSFREWFVTAVQVMRRGYTVVQAAPVKALRAFGGLETLATGMEIADAHGVRKDRMVVGTHSGSRMEVIVFDAVPGRDYQQYLPTFERFLRTVQYPVAAGAPARAAAPAVAAVAPLSGRAGLRGLYVGSSDLDTNNNITRYNYFFFPDGHVYSNLPRGGGLASFTYAQARRSDPKNCGVYAIQGRRIAMHFPGQKPDAESYAPAADGFQWGDIHLYRVARADGLRLSGHYQCSSVVSVGSSYQGNQTFVGSDQDFYFSPNGRFSNQSFSGLTGAVAGVTGRGGGSGVYRISGNMLELRYGTGQVRRMTFFVYPDEVGKAQPGLIVIDGGYYLRR